jgi:acyl-CoA synthetase (AMP-forming)/AMP-acid ligase II
MRTMRELIQRNADYFPDREAHVCGDRRLTFGQYADRALRLAGGLYSLGLRHQDRFAILALNRLEYYECYAAAEVSGFILAPVNFRLAPPEIVYMLRDSAARILIFDAQFAPVLDELRGELRSVERYVCIGEGCPDWAVSFESLIAEGSPQGPPITPRADDYVYLWYTSGTTGKPKGVPWRHQAAVLSAQMNAAATEYTGLTRMLQVTPLFHIGGKGYAAGATWAAGAIVLHRSFDPVAMLETIQRERITMTFMVAAMLQAVLEVPNLMSYDLSSMRMICTAAAPIPVPLLKRAMDLLGPIFSVQYGCTELGSITALPRNEVNPTGTPDEIRRLGSVGHPVPEIEFRLLDESGNCCAVGSPGEVVVRSPTMLDGYWNNTPASIEALRGGWYHTGDIGVVDEQGYVFLIDRKKDMIISGGENVYSREVEETLAQHPAVLECAVIGVPHPKWVEVVKAVVVLRPGAKLTESDLIAHCKQLIASYKCPKSIDFIAELPRLATGKLNKPELRARYTKRTE